VRPYAEPDPQGSECGDRDGQGDMNRTEQFQDPPGALRPVGKTGAARVLEELAELQEEVRRLQRRVAMLEEWRLLGVRTGPPLDATGFLAEQRLREVERERSAVGHVVPEPGEQPRP
jgi:hypothetical protein